jgi:hypothetical protein
MNDIDALTLKLLTSKKKYNTYLGTVEPDNAGKIRDYCDAVKTNKDRIKAILVKYLDDPETQITNELDDSVESCLKELLRHLEVRDRESKSARNDYDETSDGSDSCEATKEQDETSEGSEDENAEEEIEQESFEDKANKPKKQSYWGNSVKRAGTLDEFVKSHKKA